MLTTFACVYKYGQREAIHSYAEQVLEWCHGVLKSQKYTNNALVRKLVTKLAQRLSLSKMKPVIPKWRYSRGVRSLHLNLNKDNASNVPETQNSDLDCEQGAENDVPELVEEVVELLLNGLQDKVSSDIGNANSHCLIDKDTVVRWSASKGVGRLTERLPQNFAQEVVDSVIALFSDRTFQNAAGEWDISCVSDQCWHGACLAVAELARRGKSFSIYFRIAEITFLNFNDKSMY